jgi:hypothetical protein
LNKEEGIHQGFQLLLRKLNKPDRKYSLRVANRLFADKTCEVLQVSCISRIIAVECKAVVVVEPMRRTLENTRKLQV